MSGTTSLSTTGSTAPVLEYLCLFTRDLRRKQKRWQDGRLKYHTFNKRIMVYDDRGNFVGDTHWRADCDLDAGEEVELERGGVIVQISDCVGRQTQDLSELIDKPLQEKQQRHAAAASRTPAPSLVRRPDPRLQPPPDHFQLRHRPLKDLIGTPTGHHGRAAVPVGSPFEQRHGTPRSSDPHDEERPGKRRKRDNTPPSKMGYARSLFGATLSLSGAPVSSAPLRRPAAETHQRLPGPPNSSSDNALPRLDGPRSPEPPDRVAGRHRSSSVEITTAVQHAPAPESAPRLGTTPRATRDPPSNSNQGAVSRTSNQYPLREMPNPAAPARRTVQPRTTKCAQVSENGLQLGRPASPEERTKLVNGVQRKPRGASAIPSRQAIEQLSPEIIEIVDEGDGMDGAERDKTDAAGPKTELRLKSKRKRGLLLVSEQTTSRSKDQGAIQPGRSRQNHPPHPAASLGQASHRRRKEASQCSKTLADETPQEENPPFRGEETAYHHSVEEDIDDVGTTDERKDGPVLLHNDNATGPVAPVPAGPRLIRLGRKSVKSRELIGFVPKDASAPNGSERSALIGAGQPRTEETSEESSDPSHTIAKDLPAVKDGGKAVTDNPRKGALHFGLPAAGLASEGLSLAPSRCSSAAGKPTSEPGVGILSNNGQPRAVSPQPVVCGSCHAGDHQLPRAKLLTRELARPASTTPGCLDEGLDESGSVQGIGNPAEAKSHSSRHSEQNLDQAQAPAVPKPDSVDICDASAAVQGAQNRPSKLPNPATRGRKAALKADAAGQAPQCFLPVDTTVGLVTRSGGGSSSATPGAGKNEPARRKMTFPGFVSVGGGGPWSREAHDLLATGRPG